MASSWERLYSSTLESAGTTIDTGVGGIAAKDYLKIIIDVIPTSSTGSGIFLRFNGDTGDNYPIRRSTNGASDSTIAGTGYDYWYSGYGGSTEHRHVVLDIINVLNKEKLIVHHQVVTTAGAGNAPNRIETVGKWANTSAQITDVHIHSASFTGSDTFDPGTTMTIWGADDPTSTAKDKSTIIDVPTGTRYEELDTKTIYRRVAGKTFSQPNTDNQQELYPPTGSSRTEICQLYQTGQVLVGEAVTSASFFIRKNTSAEGDLKAFIREIDGTLVATSTTIIDGDNLTTSYVERTFEFPATTIKANDMICISSELLTSGQVQVHQYNTNITNGLYYMKIGSTYSLDSNTSAKMTVTYDSWTERGTA